VRDLILRGECPVDIRLFFFSSGFNDCSYIFILREGLQRYPFVAVFDTKDLVKSPTLVVTPNRKLHS